MEKTQPRPETVRLSYRDGQVVVTPEDQDLFCISAARATEACRDAVRKDGRIKWFKTEILLPLHEWCVARSGQVAACYIPVPAGQIQVFVVTTSIRFDFSLAHEIADFERKLAGGGLMIGISQLPAADEGSLATFFNPQGALEVYAQREPAPGEGRK
jgi:hypothetical protein